MLHVITHLFGAGNSKEDLLPYMIEDAVYDLSRFDKIVGVLTGADRAVGDIVP
ncbi:MAG: hypothetical protein R3C68_11090 [Myxococcota bacterium]